MKTQLILEHYSPSRWVDVCRVHDEARILELQNGGVDVRAFKPLSAVAEEDQFFNSQTLIARFDEETVGFVSWKTAYISWLYVRPDFHRQGVGRKLLSAAIERAGPEAWTKIITGNEPALSMYTSVGMELVSVSSSNCEGYSCEIARLALPASRMHIGEAENILTLRLMTENDLPMLHDWLNRPHIVQWWGGEEERPSLEDVCQQYLPRILEEEAVTPYIAMLDQESIGYAQSYVALGSGDGWWEDETDPGVRGIDQVLANASQLNQGLGTILVRTLTEHLFSDEAVTKIQTDPAPNNHRAIRCYEKAGFVRQGNIVTPDGPAVYMVRNRSEFDSV